MKEHEPEAPAQSRQNNDSNESLKIQAQKDLEKLRNIITAQAIAEQNQQRKAEAREYVAEVITEALDDREHKDESVSRLLVEKVEKSLQQSAEEYRKQFVDYLYPLVGSLARKFVSTFIQDFIEKTNELIENSVSVKSLNWRYRAWRSGVSFSKYVASQTYKYHIQQVLLIHRETGLLLNSVSAPTFADDNSDLVSSMLTAINDFVNDSFQKHEDPERTEYNLDEIKTDDFTLYLRQGPQAMLVAAVLGNISPEAKNKLQKTLENIHSGYLTELRKFDGDSTSFYQTSNELSECLLSEEVKPPKKKKPWIAIILLGLGFCAFNVWIYVKWETNYDLQKLKDLPRSAGIVLSSAEVTGLRKISATVLRDPSSLTIDEWLKQTDINKEWLNITEQAYVSLEPSVIEAKLQSVINKFKGVTYLQSKNEISGELSGSDLIVLNNDIQKIPGIDSIELQQNIRVSTNNLDHNNANQHAMTIVAGEISQLQIDFELASSVVTASQQQKLRLIVTKLEQLRAYAKMQNLEVKLMILGTSDSIGSLEVNRRLSLERARNVSLALQNLGVEQNNLMTAGLGIIEDAAVGTNIRKAILNVVYN